MSRFVETIRIEKGFPQNLHLHEERMERTLYELYRINRQISLTSLLHCPDNLRDKRVKCRVLYDSEVRTITFEGYRLRQVCSIKLVTDNEIDYHLKMSDRSCFSRWMEGIPEDDILIVKNGLITDTSYANIIFNEKGNWFTPALPLLEGTKRKQLLLSGFLKERNIRVDELARYSEARIINAMLDPFDLPAIQIHNIR